MCYDVSLSVNVIEQSTLYQTPQLWTLSVLPHPDIVLSLDSLLSAPHLWFGSQCYLLSTKQGRGTLAFVIPKGMFTQ